MAHLKGSILYPFIAFVGLLAGALAIAINVEYNARIDKKANDKHTAVESTFAREIHSHEKVMMGILEAIAADHAVVTRFANRDRETLYQQTRGLFEFLKKELQITHFYFILPDRSVFLRAHKRDRYGDVLTRETLRMAAESNQVASGIEQGTFGILTLRTVRPLYMGSRLLGYIEVGGEVSEILEDVSLILKTPLYLLADKKHLSRAAWEQGAEIMGRSHDWDRYDNFVINQRERELPALINTKINELAYRMFTSGGEALIDGGLGKIILGPIIDASGAPLAAFMAYQDLSLDKAAARKVLYSSIALIFFTALIVVFIFWRIISRVEARIVDYEDNLIAEKANAEQSSQAKSIFLSTMSHELRTPLNAILGFSDIIRAQIFGPLENKTYLTYVDDIHSSGEQLLHQVDEILHFSDLEQGTMDLVIEEVNLNPLLLECLDGVRNRASEAGISLTMHPDKTQPWLPADRKALRTCVDHLLTNAIIFSKSGSTVTLSLAQTPEGHQISVQDEGIGISGVDIPRITEPFIQIERQRNDRFHEGSGLGLTITKRLIELHGGSLKIESTPDVGTTATLHLPRQDTPSTVDNTDKNMERAPAISS